MPTDRRIVLNWTQQVPITGEGNRLGTLQLKLPERGAERNAKLTINGYLDRKDDFSATNAQTVNSILDADILFDYNYAEWIRLLAIIGGCIGYSLFDTLTSKPDGKFSWSALGLKTMLLGLVGGLAFLIEDTKLLGFDVDKTTIKGNVLFGFLVGCLGLDGIMRRIQEFVRAK
jgi:hypothetical protein